MAFFSWIDQEAALSDLALTVRAQEVQTEDVDETFQDIFAPRRNVDSTKLSVVMGTVDFRPVSERREWNARGRQIHQKTPDISEMQFIPVESYWKIGEEEIQHYGEATRGNMAVFREIVRTELPTRVDDLAMANIRRLELDLNRAWTTGTIIVKHPHNGTTQTVSYGFDTARYQTAGTAWDDAGVDAYQEFLAWCEDGADAIGSLGGVRLRRSDYRVIQADAPVGLNGLPLNRAQFEDQVSSDLGVDFRFYITETTYDEYVDGGLTTTDVEVWPDATLALIPAGVQIGNMCYAPVVRAYDLVPGTSAGHAPIDVRGQAVFREVGGNGRELTTECQVNAFPVPDERKMWVIDIGT